MSNKAFTLIELLIVIAIIAILTVAFLPGALKAPAKARDAQRVKAINDIAAVLESYAAEHNGNLPDHNNADKGCLVKVAGDLTILASYFPNNEFSKDPKPVGNGACNIEANKNAYFYRKLEDGSGKYIVGAVMEVQASGNTSLSIASLGVGEDSIEYDEILPSGGGTATTVTPDKDTPYYIKVGP